MKNAVKLINLMFLLICLILLSGEKISAQKTKSANDKPKRLTPAEIVFEFEQMLAQSNNECTKNHLITYLAPSELANGNTEKAKTYAEKLLAESKTLPKSCSVGDAIHVGNLVLGKIALASGNIDEAKYRLLEAGKTPGSPSLNSFGPNMLLAQDLLEKNERAVVLEYFDLCATFWKSEFNELKDWKKLVKGGGFPDFGSNSHNLVPWVDVEILNSFQKIVKEDK